MSNKYTVLYGIILRCIVLYCFVLYCIANDNDLKDDTDTYIGTV